MKSDPIIVLKTEPSPNLIHECINSTEAFLKPCIRTMKLLDSFVSHLSPYSASKVLTEAPSWPQSSITPFLLLHSRKLEKSLALWALKGFDANLPLAGAVKGRYNLIENG